MDPFLLLVASGLCLLAAFCFYLASPNQLLLKRSYSAKMLNLGAMVMAFLAVISLMQFMGKPAAIFLFVSLMMLYLSLLPLLIAVFKKTEDQRSSR